MDKFCKALLQAYYQQTQGLPFIKNKLQEALHDLQSINLLYLLEMIPI